MIVYSSGAHEMRLQIANKEALDAWLNERRELGHDVFSVKGPAPNGALYSDGTPIAGHINAAWRDGTTGEIFTLLYL